MAMKIVYFDAHVAAKIFEAAEHVAFKLYVVACLVRGAFNKLPDFFGMDTFINRTHKKL